MAFHMDAKHFLEEFINLPIEKLHIDDWKKQIDDWKNI